MKKELVLSELTLEQKLGLMLCANANPSIHPDEFERILRLVRKRQLGAVWVSNHIPGREEFLRALNEEADYPLIIIGDAESGSDKYPIANAAALGACNFDTAIGYTYGKSTATELRALGYNAINGPVVDMSEYSVRHMGCDPEGVSRLAVAIGQGFHDGGLLTIAKHYPGQEVTRFAGDSHMQETLVTKNEQELIDFNLRPYLAMKEAGVLDGIMTRHCRLPAIDADYPATLSEKVIGIIKNKFGFDGYIITDAMAMMGIVLKYGRGNANGLAIRAGHSATLPWDVSIDTGLSYLRESFEAGLFDEARLNDAVAAVLRTQHKVRTLEPKFTDIDDNDVRNLRRVNEDCIAGYYADGVPHGIDRNGRHLFALLTERDLRENEPAPAAAVPFAHEWFFPHRVMEMVKKEFPNSDVTFVREYPSSSDNIRFFDKQIPFDDVVYITNTRPQAYIGRDCLTERVLSVMRALQTTNRIAAVLHFGNPFVTEEIPAVDRLLLGYGSEACIAHALKILAGDCEPVGSVPFPDYRAPRK